ncbi:MAG: HAD family hydrolase [Oscillospiraceae bacterium]|nr:HAD family hydrolase [Oscillospiraceae bacterium]
MKYWCFDLFHTLVDVPCDMPLERELLGLPQAQWERCVMQPAFYTRRALGLVSEPIEIVRELIAAFGKRLDEAGEREFLRRRVARFGRALTRVQPEILETLQALKARGCKLCLVSNADAIDVLHWVDSPLAPLFDEAIFSYRLGMLKPEPGIYLLAAQRLGVPPQECVFVGDGGSDELAGAKAVGMRAVQARHIAGRDVEGADAVIDEFRDIVTWMEGQV